MNTDDELMDRLRRIAAEVDPPPDLVLESARAALSTRWLDGELALLVSDSAVDAGVAVRGDDEPARLLSFETATVCIELQVREAGGQLSVRGLVVGVSDAVLVQTAACSCPVPVDAEGWFTVENLPVGAFRLRARALDGTDVTTSWVTG